MAILTVAVRKPKALGSKVTTNVVELDAAIAFDGIEVTVKSPACVHPITT